MKFTADQIGIIKDALAMSANARYADTEGAKIHRAKIRGIMHIIDGERATDVTAILKVVLGNNESKYVLNMAEATDNVLWTENIDAAMVFIGVRDIERAAKEIKRRTGIDHEIVFV